MPPKGAKGSSAVWYDKHRKCEDGSRHEGVLELITWNGTDDDGARLGWGAVYRDEAEEHKKRFQTEFGGDQEKFYDYWPQGFRWTCCGCSGDQQFGCDHHGSGSTPCRCDFCVMGKPLPEGISPPTAQTRKGLKLLRGPDPRSFNPVQASFSEMMRGLLGMDVSGRDNSDNESEDDSNSRRGGAGRTGGAGRSGGGSAGVQAPAKSKAAAKGTAKGAARGAKGSSSSTASGGGGNATAASATAAVTAAAAGAVAAAAAASTSAAGASGSAAAPPVKVCAVCGRGERQGGGRLLKCSACKATRYCSSDCQAAHWPSHKGPCKEMRKAA